MYQYLIPSVNVVLRSHAYVLYMHTYLFLPAGTEHIVVAVGFTPVCPCACIELTF